MSACPHHKETLMLDIFGELNRNRAAAWEQHLNGCPGCRTEKETISRTLKLAKRALEAPQLSEAEAAAMRHRVVRELTADTPRSGERKQAFFFSRAFIPTLASACVLLMALGFMASKLLTGPTTAKRIQLSALQEQLPEEDIEIINNMDILSNLDALDRLSQAIDRSESPSPHNNVQGRSGHGKKTIFS